MCALCGKHGKSQCMVKSTEVLETKTKTIKLKQRLNCANYGIYAAVCKCCGEIYVGQTKNKFSTRWTSHRSFWKKFGIDELKNDQAALLYHYHKAHYAILKSRPSLAYCFEVVFLQQPRMEKLDMYEDIWFHRMNATINIKSLITPNVK